MKLGIGSYTYMWSIGVPGAVPRCPMDAQALLTKAIDLGVKVVQFGPNLPLDKLKAEELHALATKAKACGITIELGTRGMQLPHLNSQLEIARLTGATLLRSVPELEDGSTPSIAELTEQLRAAVPLLSDAGIRLGIENSLIPANALASMLESIGSPWIGVTLDTVNSLAIPEGTQQVVQLLAPYVVCLHIKDFMIERLWHRMGFHVSGRQAGSGMLDIPFLLNTLAAAGVSPNAILELWPPEQLHLEDTILLEHAWAIQSIDYLRRYIPN